MLNLKKTAVAVLAFVSSAVFAGTMGPVCTPGSVTVPCEHSAWDFGGYALYLEPAYSGHNYVGSVQNTTTSNEHYNNGAPHWGWGFKLEGSYHFYTGNDLNLNWYHFDNTTNKSFAVGSGSSAIDPLSSAFSGTGPGAISASRKPKWDAVNLEFGQHVDFGDRKKIRFHGGVQYVRVNTKMNLSNSLLGTLNTAVNMDLTYNGFGPRAGMDMAYHWGNGFAMYANSALSLLAGSGKFNNSTTGSVALGLPVTTYTGSTTAVVPEVEAKLGTTYTYAMAQGDLSLDVGWMWINYFNAQGCGGGMGRTMESDFALQGPFIGLKWLGNVA